MVKRTTGETDDEGVYLAPEPYWAAAKSPPPQMIISDPVQTAVWLVRAAGAFTKPTSRQESLTGL